MNLLEETLYAIKKHGESPENILFIGSMESGESCTFKQFKELANFNYDDGYGGQEIREDLIIVFKSGNRLVREEYDGAEWWKPIPAFKTPLEAKQLLNLKNETWCLV